MIAHHTHLKTLAGSHGARAALRLAEKSAIFISVTPFGVTVSSLKLKANCKLSIKLPKSKDYTTIAGFFMAKAGKLLSQGEVVEYQNTEFTIEKVDYRRVSKVRVISIK